MTLEAPAARILVVDDEPNIADLLSAALTFEGYQVGVAATSPARRRMAPTRAMSSSTLKGLVT